MEIERFKPEFLHDVIHGVVLGMYEACENHDADIYQGWCNNDLLYVLPESSLKEGKDKFIILRRVNLRQIEVSGIERQRLSYVLEYLKYCDALRGSEVVPDYFKDRVDPPSWTRDLTMDFGLSPDEAKLAVARWLAAPGGRKAWNDSMAGPDTMGTGYLHKMKR